MAIVRRVYVSMPSDHGLTADENAIKWGIVDRLEQAGYEPQVFDTPRGSLGFARGRGWTLENVDHVMRHCVGAAVIGLPKWEVPTADGPLLLPTEYTGYEGAVAWTYGLPIFAVVDRRIAGRVLFNPGLGLELTFVTPGQDRTWLDSDAFRGPFDNFTQKLAERRDVFLGYCSHAKDTAKQLKRLLRELDVSVLDWMKFKPAGSIMENIVQSARQCSAGIFLFTKDDPLKAKGAGAMPRDNVVFEAGYFAAAKGKDRVLIIREKGSKMPADLGGDIYGSLEDRSDIGPVRETLRRFVRDRL